jgi:hypothetical protein
MRVVKNKIEKKSQTFVRGFLLEIELRFSYFHLEGAAVAEGAQASPNWKQGE